MFYQTYTARNAVEITHGSDGMVPSALHDVIVICSERVPFRHCRGRGDGSGQHVFVPGDPDL